MTEPLEMRTTRPMAVHGGTSTTTDVWAALCASRDGDYARFTELVSKCPALSTCQYNYTPPLHFAVREGHLGLVQDLISKGAVDPTYQTYPFLDTLPTMARDRGHDEIADLLDAASADPVLAVKRKDTGAIDLGQTAAERRFQAAVNKGDISGADRMLKSQSELARNELAFWAEGILAGPANGADIQMIELLTEYGVRVPDVSKWAPAYYFKHYEVAAFLMARGMNPNHRSWQEVTLLHNMAQKGNIPKAKLLLDHAANIDLIDDEYHSTPLGLAVRWGQWEMAAFLLERGADPCNSGAPWATPLQWARKKGHTEIEMDLLKAGAH